MHPRRGGVADCGKGAQVYSPSSMPWLPANCLRRDRERNCFADRDGRRSREQHPRWAPGEERHGGQMRKLQVWMILT